MDNTNIDGKWAWLVLVSAFLVHIMTFGMAWSTGVYYVIFVDVFDQQKSVTAWACALPTAMMYAIGKFNFSPFSFPSVLALSSSASSSSFTSAYILCIV